MEKIIQIHNLTKSYGIHKGVFNLDFDVYKGEVFGFIGPNGAGKTTTIRHLLGFIASDEGFCEIFNLETKENAALIQKKLGYLPGEITFFDQMTGIEFLKLMASLRHLEDLSKMNELITFFEFDPSGRIKKMSKGMKQKLGLVSAFMHDPEVLILDEPTSGLDPLMQTKFVELILNEKKKGKTILMSSHSFDEIEKTCDRAGIIKDGVLVALEDIKDLKSKQRRVFHVRFNSKKELDSIKQDLQLIHIDDCDALVEISGDINPLIRILAKVQIDQFEEKSQSLEEIFMHFYQRESVS
ncbi:MAG: ABC transporter ATP-binding protein [Acholeplasmataceae bacterium]|nr:ABC transporter ATP-binding protein [Acholeplasmataceae bacterium]